MRTFFILILIFFLFPTLSFSKQEINQNQATIGVVDSIIIIGNNKTKAFVLLQEIKITTGDTLTQALIEDTKNRLYNLQLFNSVDIFTYPKENKHYDVIIQVSERWFIYPIPIFGIKDHNWKKLYFGLGLLNTNFRGMNEKTFLFGTLGYEPSLQLFYRTPNLKIIKGGFLEFTLSLLKAENRSINVPYLTKNFNIVNYNTHLTLGKRLNLHQDIWINIGYQLLKVDKEFSRATLNPSGIDNLPIFGIGYKYDTRDLNDFTMRGTFFSYQLNKYGLFQENINYAKNYFDFRRYIPLLKKITFAFRNYLVLSHGKKIPSYSLSHLGYSEKIRGHFTEIFEGENVLTASSEFRIFVIEPKYFNIEFIPLPEFSTWKFGIAAVLFGDAGKVWYNKEQFKWTNLKKGYGIGVNFILPYHLVFRIEYAFNEYNKKEFIFDLYSSF
ncbi:MAG: hypothetical protein IGBAC_1094 [Ignavibacteriae bacterium]|nr:MAG: hypothetical protein IGBAC_1094 [Ignavibacteriota bacterium]